MSHTKIKSLLFLLLCFSSESFAQTTDWRNNRLQSLEKVTVGPSDNYQSALLPKKNRLFFTRSQNQISQLYSQDLTTGETTRLLGADTDAKDPAISPDGKWLAMTNFRFDAQGDICLYSLVKDQELKCLTDKKSMEHSPFWIDNEHLGFIRRSINSISSELVVKDIVHNTEKVLFSGNIYAPVAAPNSRYLAYYLQKQDKQNGIYLYDLKEGEQFGVLQLSLPGISSHASFSTDSRYLYFGHYLNDTSADQSIDGEDHSVVFRVEIEKLFKAKGDVLPEQLISVAQNCNFPTLTENHLYVTCAYEGSLDIYRLGLEGVVPAHWNRSQVAEAHQNATSYEDRLLLLNTLRYRFDKNNTVSQNINFYERQLSNHLEIGELSAALYFVKKIEILYKQDAQGSLEEFYHNLAILLQLRSAALQQPPGLLTAAFRFQLEEQRKSLRMAHRSSGGVVFSAWIDTLLKNNLSALKRLNSVWEYDRELIPLAYYLALELDRYLLKEKPELLLARFLDASKNSTINLDARLFYAFKYLQHLEVVQTDRDKRVATIQAAIKQEQEQKIKDLFLNEIDVLNLIQAKDLGQKRSIFTTLTKRLKGFKDQDIRRLAHIRAIKLFGAANEHQFMELLSRHWLIVSHQKEISFADVAEQYSLITMNKAYGILNDGDLNSAANTFYSAIRQTNDLEAHYDLLVLGLTNNDAALSERVKKFYEVLERDNLIGANTDFVKALKLVLLDPQESEETLSKAALLLENLKPVGLSPALRDLLLGYLYHRQLLNTKERYSYNKELYQKTHYQYMLALDQGYDNERIQAAVLENLGQLHFSVGNYGMASDFFAQRTQIPFQTIENEAELRSHFAQVLFYNNDFLEAAKQAQRALALMQEAGRTDELIAFLEKAAFYNMQAANYKQAVILYEKILEEKKLQGTNRAKAQLGYGYSLLKLQEIAKAKKIFEELLRSTSALKTLPVNAERLISFEPKRLELLAYGFLVECTDNPKEKAKLLQERIKILDSIEDKTKEFAYDEKGRLELVIKALQQEAIAYEESGLLVQTVKKMTEAVELLPEYLDQGGGNNSQAVIHTLTNYLSLALLHPQEFKKKPVEQLKSLVETTIEKLRLKNYTPPMSSMQRFGLKILYSAYSAKVSGKKSQQDFEILISTIQRDPDWLTLTKERPDLAKELEEMIEWIKKM